MLSLRTIVLYRGPACMYENIKKTLLGENPPRKGEKRNVRVYYCYDTDNDCTLQCCSSPLIAWPASDNRDQDKGKDWSACALVGIEKIRAGIKERKESQKQGPTMTTPISSWHSLSWRFACERECSGHSSPAIVFC